MILRAATKRWLAVPHPKYIEIRSPYETLRAQLGLEITFARSLGSCCPRDCAWATGNQEVIAFGRVRRSPACPPNTMIRGRLTVCPCAGNWFDEARVTESGPEASLSSPDYLHITDYISVWFLKYRLRADTAVRALEATPPPHLPQRC
jgi:hypothetical protein